MIPPEDWRKTPESVKKLVKELNQRLKEAEALCQDRQNQIALLESQDKSIASNENKNKSKRLSQR